MKHFSTRNGVNWKVMAAAVARTVRMHAERRKSKEEDGCARFNLRNVGRDATLAAVLQDLFGIQDVSLEQLQYIGNEIHRLTVRKKELDRAKVTSEYIIGELQRAVDMLIKELRQTFTTAIGSSPLARHVLCEVAGSSQDYNPLNLVIPAFEAPWRGVFYTLLATLQTGQIDPWSLDVLRSYRPESPPTAAVRAVVYESLRLYPPIRRVRRDNPVDIEAVQRDVQYWGHQALQFQPKRFLDPDGQIRQGMVAPGSAWMPFAVGSMRCPTASGYSVRLIAVVVGEVLRGMIGTDAGNSWEIQGREWDSSTRRGDRLRAGRQEYVGVDLVIRRRL
jgi:hypothetical protein